MSITKIVRCPRTGCKRKAQIDPTYGVMPCKKCQDEDSTPLHRRPEFYTVTHRNRVQEGRDAHEGDLLQPFIGNKINPEFAKRYPDRVNDYFTKKELESI